MKIFNLTFLHLFTGLFFYFEFKFTLRTLSQYKTSQKMSGENQTGIRKSNKFRILFEGRKCGLICPFKHQWIDLVVIQCLFLTKEFYE